MFEYAKLQEIEYKSLVYSSVLCNNVFVLIWIFLFTSSEKQVSEQFELLYCAWLRLRVIVCQGVGAQFQRSSNEKVARFVSNER